MVGLKTKMGRKLLFLSCRIYLWVAVLMHLAMMVTADDVTDNQQAEEVIEDTLRGEQAWVWGAWGRWSSCSKTCGGGVSMQTRECVFRSVMNENDSTASGLILTSSNALSSLRRSRCFGPAERYRECNTAPCPGSLPGAGRAQQCAAYDRRPFRGRHYHWVPYIDGNSPCTLNCRPLGKQFYATLALVADGTPCTKPGATAVCVQGVCKRKTVQLWIRRYASTGEIDNLKRGRKSITYTEANARHRDIIAAHTANPFATTRSTALQHGVSMDVVRRHLHAGGIHCYRPAKKIALSPAHRQARIEFARQYLNFNWQDNIVIFTDEKCFKSDKDGRIFLWRTTGTRYNEVNTLPCRTSGRISLGYWGWMSSMGPGELVEVGGRMTGLKYLELLRDVMLPSVRNVYPEPHHIYFVHDNCAVHRAQVVRDWLRTQSNITIIDWPSKSPDINPIENLWGQMVLNWDPSEVRTKINLEKLVTSTWESYRGRDMCWNMVTGMSRRLQEVMNQEGAATRY